MIFAMLLCVPAFGRQVHRRPGDVMFVQVVVSCDIYGKVQPRFFDALSKRRKGASMQFSSATYITLVLEAHLPSPYCRQVSFF